MPQTRQVDSTHTSTDYIGQVRAQAVIVPGRAAYLVKAGSAAGFRRAVQEATTRWGGATEPIVLVGGDANITPWERQLIEISEADGLVNIDVTPQLAEKVAKRLGKPLVDIAHIDNSTVTKFSTFPLNLDEPGHGSLVTSHLIARDGAELWEVAIAGDISDAAAAELAQAGRDFRRADSAEQIGRAQLTGQTGLDLGLRHFREHAAENGPMPSPAVIFVTRPKALRAIARFWNLRALRPLGFASTPIVLLPVGEYANWLDFPQQFRALLARPSEFTPDVVIDGDFPGPTLDLVARSLGLQATTEKPHRSRTFPPPKLREEPFTYRCDLDIRADFVFKRSYGLQMNLLFHLYSAPTQVEITSPIPATGAGYALLRFQSEVFNALPKVDSIAKHLASNATWRGSALEFGVFLEPRYEITLTVPPLGEALRIVLAERSQSHELSDKGKIGFALTGALSASDMRRNSTYRCLRALTTPRTRAFLKQVERLPPTNRAALEAVATEWGREARRKFSSARLLRDLCGPNAAGTLEILAEADWVERGLVIKCSACGISSFMLLRDASAGARCPGCGSREAFAGDTGGPEIHYRLNSLVDRAVDQGVIPHLIAVEALRSRYHSVYALPGVLIKGHDLAIREFDVLALCDGRILAAEVKAQGADFTRSEVYKDVARSRSIQADVHVMAAVDAIPDGARELANRLCTAARMELVCLSGEEIFATESGTK